jgi:hypothetical protein
MAGGVVQVVEHLPSKCEALSSAHYCKKQTKKDLELNFDYRNEKRRR